VGLVDRILQKFEATDQESHILGYSIKSVDYDKQLVTGIVYSPWRLDMHGHYMSSEELEKLAHSTLLNGLQKNIDLQHNNRLVKATIVESYIDREGSFEIPAGSWIATTKIEDTAVWKMIKNGKINGYSMEIRAKAIEHDAEVEYDSVVFGETQPDPYDGHTHLFLVKLDETGKIKYGKTSKGGPDSHEHAITGYSITEQYDGHSHRILV
jgi:hypothetical protein